MKFVVLMDDKELKFLEVFDAFEVPLGEGTILTRADMFSQTILAECGIPWSRSRLQILLHVHLVLLLSYSGNSK